MPSRVRLSVNVDHVATVRQARRAPYPDPVEAARLAEEAGAAGITAHLRVDRRHIQDADVEHLRAAVRGKLNLEMSVDAGMLAVAVAVRPDQVTLVPERPEEVTTEGGLDLAGQGELVLSAAELLVAAGITVSVFIDPDERQIEALARLGGARRLVSGAEINTDAYTRAALAALAALAAEVGGGGGSGGGGGGAAAGEASGGGVVEAEGVRAELARVRRAGALIAGHGLHLYAGHGLTTASVRPIAAVAGMEELNIGHALIARAVLVGIPEAVREMLRAMAGEPA